MFRNVLGSVKMWLIGVVSCVRVSQYCGVRGCVSACQLEGERRGIGAGFDGKLCFHGCRYVCAFMLFRVSYVAFLIFFFSSKEMKTIQYSECKRCLSLANHQEKNVYVGRP